MATEYKVTRSRVPHSENAGGTTIIYQTVQSSGNSQPFTPPSEMMELYQGPIAVGDLLDIDIDDITPGMTWLVYANGQADDPEGCWSTSTFTLDGETYQPGTFFTASFTRDDNDDDIVKFTPNYNPDLTNVVRMTEQPLETWLFTNISSGSANTRSGYYNGIKLASLKHYSMDRGAKTLRPSYTYDANSRTDMWDLYVPYAHYTTSQGGENTYYPGALSAVDYQRLVEGGGVAPGNGAITVKQGSSSWTFTVNQSTNTTIELAEGGSSVDIDTYFPTTPSDTHVPSTKLVSDTLANYVTRTTYQNITGQKDFTNSQFAPISICAYTGSYQTEPAIGFQSYNGSWETIGFIGVKRSSSLSGYPAFWASQGGTPQQLVRVSERGDSTHGVYIDAQGFTKQCTGGGGTDVPIDTSWPSTLSDEHVPSTKLVKTSLADYALKSEIPTVPTNVSAFTNDAGYLTQHQSLAAYALKSEIPTKQTVLDWGFVNRRYVTFHRTYAGQSGWPYEIVASRGVSNKTQLYNGRTARILFDDITTQEGIYTFMETHSIRAFQVVKSTHKYYELPIVEARHEMITTDQGSKSGLGIYITSSNVPLPYQEDEVSLTFVIDTL